MFKRTDYIIISMTCFVLGIALMSQFYSSKSSKNLLQPENNDVLAVEIEKIAKTNSAMKINIAELTKKYNDILVSSNPENSYARYQEDMNKYDQDNGATPVSGQGAEININGTLSTAQLVDLTNALKNIGAEHISINEKRITLTTYIDSAIFSTPYKVNALGNSNLLESALTRKGGIIEQIQSKNINAKVNKRNMITIPSGEIQVFRNANILDK